MSVAGRAIVVDRLLGREAIRAFARQWQALVDADPDATLYQAPDLFFAWHDTAADGEQAWLLVARDGDRPIGCAALALRELPMRGVRIRVLSFGSPRGDVVASERRGEVLTAIADWLLRQSRDWDLLQLEDIRTATAEAIQRHLGAERGFAVEAPTPAPAEAWLDASIGWSAYLQLRGAHFRHRLKPQTRKIERLGTVRVRRFAGEGLAAAYDEFLSLEPRSWKSKSDDTRLPDRERAAFGALVRQGPGRIRPSIMFLDVDERPVAAMLSLAHGRNAYLFVTYFDDSVRAHYPGRRLFLECIQDAFADPQVDELSFVGAYPFAMAWCDQTRPYVNLKVHGNSLRARWARLLAPRPAAQAEPIATPAEHA